MLMRATSAPARCSSARSCCRYLVVMFATVTRGGIVALGAGHVYLVWVQRRHDPVRRR